jgi:hypothetical protein
MEYTIRPLTQTEIDNFPGDAHTDVAMLSDDGVWYYAESEQNIDEDGNVYDESMFIAEDGDYIPV